MVLEGHPVEGHEVGGLGGDLVRVGLAALGAEVDLGGDDDVLAVHGRQPRWVDDDGPVHAGSQVQAHRRGGAVVKPDPRVLGLEGVDEGLPGVDRAHRLIGRGDPRVEVQGVAHRAVVDQGDLEGVPHLAAQDGAGDLPVEGQAPLGDAGADRHDLLLDGEGVPVGHGAAVGTGGGRRQGGVEGLEACGQLGRVVGNRVLAGAGRLALATAVLVGAGGRPARGDVEDHALGAVAGDGAPALDRTRDDAGVEGALGSGGDAPGGLAGGQDEVVDLVGGVVQGDDEPVAGGDVDRVRHEPQALHLDGGVDSVPGGRDVLGGSALTTVADDAADDDGSSRGEQSHEDAAAVS